MGQATNIRNNVSSVDQHLETGLQNIQLSYVMVWTLRVTAHRSRASTNDGAFGPSTINTGTHPALPLLYEYRPLVGGLYSSEI